MCVWSWSEGSVLNDNELFTLEIGSVAQVFATCYHADTIMNSEICFINYRIEERKC